MAKSPPGLLDSMMWHFRSWEEIKSISFFTASNYTMFFMILGLAAMAMLQTRSKIKASEKERKNRLIIPAANFPPITALEGFDWKTTEPEKFRPFKPKYHLTMALENMDPNELLLMDKNYEDRLNYRKKMLKEHHDIVVHVNDNKRIRPAVIELYTFLLGTYLPQRYPTMFTVLEAKWEQGTTFMVQNRVTKKMFPTNPSRLQTTTDILEILGEQIDEDFLLLLPEQTEKDPKYVLEAYMTVCSSGFNPREKLGKRLADIHGPVPSYPSKLESSMDRFFAKLEVGKYVRRVNWAITTDDHLYAVPEEGKSTNHAQEGEQVEALETLDIENTYLRNERQTLHRLPKSKALVFAFKTYLTPIAEIRDEGSGEELAQAVDGLKAGNAPGMHFYKRGAVWGEALKKYLRS